MLRSDGVRGFDPRLNGKDVVHDDIAHPAAALEGISRNVGRYEHVVVVVVGLMLRRLLGEDVDSKARKLPGL